MEEGFAKLTSYGKEHKLFLTKETMEVFLKVVNVRGVV
jgi:hypothetical protein